MIELRLVPRQRPDGALVLELNIGFRIVFGFLTTAVAVGVAGAPRIGAFPIIVLIVLVAGSLYQERWVFHPGTGQITSQNGLLMLSRQRRWPISEIEAVQYTRYRAGSPVGAHEPPTGTDHARDARRMLRGGSARIFLKYGLRTRNGQLIRIEVRRIRDWQVEPKVPGMISQLIEVPLENSPL